jgi:hypothetical protein
MSGGKLYFGDTLGTGGRGEILRANLDGTSLSVIHDAGSSLFSPLDVELGPETAVPEPCGTMLAGVLIACVALRNRWR